MKKLNNTKITKDGVLDQPTNTSKKRYAFIPLDKKSHKAALPGELMVNRETGDIYVKDDFGNVKSKTEKLEETIEHIIQNNSAELVGDLYNDQRKSYRFFFDDGVIRLDRNLILPKGAFYFTVHDMEETDKIYTIRPSRVTEEAGYMGSLINNNEYWVTIYNIEGDALTQNKFVGKRANSILSDSVEPNKLLERIEIETAKDILYIGESYKDLYCRVYAYYADHSRRDVTNANGTILEKPSVNTVGNKKIKALFYNIDDGRYAEAEKTIQVREEDLVYIVGIKVIPQVLVANNGTKSITLNIIGEFSNGLVTDITHKCIVNNFNESLFNCPQTLEITTNIGDEQIYETDYTINVQFNEEPCTVYFGDYLMWITNELDDIAAKTNLPLTHYMVREAGNLEGYYTGMTEIGYDTEFFGNIRSGKRLIIEYYDANEELMYNVFATGEFRPEGLKPTPRA